MADSKSLGTSDLKPSEKFSFHVKDGKKKVLMYHALSIIGIATGVGLAIDGFISGEPIMMVVGAVCIAGGMYGINRINNEIDEKVNAMTKDFWGTTT